MKENLTDLYFMNGLTTDVFDIADVRVTRCGYTGEDGFEVMMRNGTHSPTPTNHCKLGEFALEMQHPSGWSSIEPQIIDCTRCLTVYLSL
jgi:hypothetical protein